MKNWLLLIVLVAFSTAVFARRPPWRRGETHSYRSTGDRFTIQIVYTHNPNSGPCQAILREGKKVVWRRAWPATPGVVAVADDGQAFCALNYWNYDEHWYRSVSFYNKGGELLKEIPFFNKTESNPKYPRSCRLEKGKAIIRYSRGTVSFTATYSLPDGKLLTESKDVQPGK